MRILLVEDDAMLADAIQTALERDGYGVEHAADAVAARLALVEHAYGAILLDLGLPHGSGLDVLKALRDRYDPTPVLILTARDRLSDRVRGLDAGADDYIVKPFELEELSARLRAVSRRSQGRVTTTLSYGAVVVDPARKRVTRAGKPVTLSRHEYRTLVALMERRGWIVSREQLEEAVYGAEREIESNTIAVFIHQLRRKLGDDLIATVHGFGYRLGEAR